MWKGNKEQLKVAKRKWKRAYDADSEKREGRECENEGGEDEECETLQLPNKEAVPVKRKPGRPKKSALGADLFCMARSRKNCNLALRHTFLYNLSKCFKASVLKSLRNIYDNLLFIEIRSKFHYIKSYKF